MTKLCEIITDQFSNVSLSTVQRKYFNESQGKKSNCKNLTKLKLIWQYAFIFLSIKTFEVTIISVVNFEVTIMSVVVNF